MAVNIIVRLKVCDGVKVYDRGYMCFPVTWSLSHHTSVMSHYITLDMTPDAVVAGVILRTVTEGLLSKLRLTQ